ncbi:MAG: hypothetical protein Q8K98_03205, partial [Bacteroidota bacterium]|nr:hypothetical protein [Bacteroidota bacterium]
MKVLFRIIVATIFCLIVISVITYGQVKRTWTGSVSNDWCTPGNWNPVGAPTSNDTAVINSGTPTFSCTSAGIKVLILTGGTLSGDSTLTISGTFNWSGGTMTGTGMTVVDTGGSVNITSGVSKTLNGRTLTLRSSVTTVCTGSFTMSNGAVLANWGTLNIQADINIWTSGSPS